MGEISDKEPPGLSGMAKTLYDNFKTVYDDHVIAAAYVKAADSKNQLSEALTLPVSDTPTQFHAFSVVEGAKEDIRRNLQHELSQLSKGDRSGLVGDAEGGSLHSIRSGQSGPVWTSGEGQEESALYG